MIRSSYVSTPCTCMYFMYTIRSGYVSLHNIQVAEVEADLVGGGVEDPMY